LIGADQGPRAHLMQSRDRAAPLRRARRGLAGDRRRHRPRALTPPPPALTLRHRHRRPPTIASPSRVSDAAGHSVCKLHTRNAARWRDGWLRPPPPPPLPTATATPPPPPRTLYIREFYPPPTTVSDVHYDPRAPQRPLMLAVLPAVVLSRERDRPRYVCLCVCVCVCASAGVDGTHCCGGGGGGGVGGRRRGRGREGIA